jgi:hypothetical protein
MCTAINFSKKSLLLFFIIFSSTIAYGTKYQWTNGGGDSLWSNAANWNQGSVPGIGDTASIGDATLSSQVVLDMPTQVQRLSLGSGAVLHLNGFQAQVDSSFFANFATLGDGTYPSGKLFGSNLTIYWFENSTAHDHLQIYSSRWGHCSNSIYHGEVFYTHIGSDSEATVGNNTFHNKVSFETQGGTFRPESINPSTFNADTLHLYNNSSLGENLLIAQVGELNLNSVIIEVNNSSNGSIRIGTNGASIGNINLNGTSNIVIGDYPSGSGALYVFGINQQTPLSVQLILPSTGNLHLSYNSIKGPIVTEAKSVICNENNFYNTVHIKKSGPGTGTMQGGNYFHDLTTIENSTSASNARIRWSNVLPDTFALDLIIINSGLGSILMNYSANNTFYGGDIYLNSTSGGGIKFGGNGGTASLNFGKRLIIGGLGFHAGVLELDGFTQLDATPQSLVLTGAATRLRLQENCIWDGSFTSTSPRVEINGGTYNNTLNITKTSNHSDYSQGNGTFNDDVTISHIGSNGQLHLNAQGSNVSVFNADLTINLTGGGTMHPASEGSTIFKGHVTVNSNKEVTFGTNGGTSIFDGATTQNINHGTGLYPITFDSLIIDKSGSNLVLNSSISIKRGANFTDGIVESSTAYLMTFEDGAQAYNVSTNSHVQGPVRKYGTQAFEFPIGKGTIYSPLRISSPTTAEDHFTAEYFNYADNSYDETSLDSGLDHINACEHWTLDQGGGASNSVFVTLPWGSQSCGVDNLAELRVCRWNGSAWINHGNGGTTGNISNGTVTTSSPVSSFSPFTLGSTTINNPLPIELASFEAVQNDQVVNLYWSTYSETNNALFTIERSNDGTDWKEIISVPGAGNSTTLIEYADIDPNPETGTNFYRLKQTDFNGDFEYSHAIRVDFLKENTGVEIYPNPNDGIYFNVKLDRFDGKKVILAVRDMAGKELFTKVIFSSKEEVFRIYFEEKLPRGTYLISASSEYDFISKKLIIK